MKIKNLLCLFLSLSLCFGLLATSVFARTEDITANRYKYKTMYTSTFKDVKQTDKYYSAVKECYERGLINGKGNGIFDPNGKMTVAEAIALVVRAYVSVNHPVLIDAFDKTTPWYAAYVDYALRNELKLRVLLQNSFVEIDWSVRNNIDYDRYITVKEFCALLCSAKFDTMYNCFARWNSIDPNGKYPITRACAVSSLMSAKCFK